MKTTTLSIAQFFLFLTGVLADPKAIGLEMLYYYYIYRLQIDADFTYTIAVDCSPADHTGLECYWDEFLRHIMDVTFASKYEDPPADHTKTPDVSNLWNFDIAVTSTSYYQLPKLNTALASGTPSIARAVASMLDAANVALDTGKCETSDAQMALALAQDVISARGQTACLSIYNAATSTLPSSVAPYIFYQADWSFNWTEIFGNIDRDTNDKVISSAEGWQYKSLIRNFAQRFGTNGVGTAEDAELLAIRREFQNSINALTLAVYSAQNGSTIPVGSSVPCPPDYTTSKHRRGLVEHGVAPPWDVGAANGKARRTRVVGGKN